MFWNTEFTGKVIDCTQNLTNSTPSNWENQTSCFSNNTLLQNRSFIEYDLNNCTENVTHWDFQTANCTFICVTNFLNTSWSGWKIDGDCINNSQAENRSKIQYDSNNCNSSIENQTFFEYKNVSCVSCKINLVNTSSLWTDSSGCQNGSKSQFALIIQYDSNNCIKINSTFYKYQNISCEIPVIANSSLNVVAQNLSEVKNVSTLFSNKSSVVESSSNLASTIYLILIVILSVGLIVGVIIFWSLYNKKEIKNIQN